MKLKHDKITEIFYLVDEFCKEFNFSVLGNAMTKSGIIGQDIIKKRIFIFARKTCNT